MKKSILAMAAIVMAITSCELNEVTQFNPAGKAISFTATAGMQTKAQDIVASGLECFVVEAFNEVAQAGDSYDTPYFSAVTFTGSGTPLVYNSANKYYWPANNLDFYAYAFKNASGTWNTGDATIAKRDYRTFWVSPAADASCSPDTQTDLLYACNLGLSRAGANAGSIVGAAPLNFRHAMSKIVVKVLNTSESLDFTVSGWRVGYLDTAAVFTYNGNENNPYAAATNGAGTLDAGMWSANTDALATNHYTSDFTASAVNVKAGSSSASQLTGEMILIPQTTTAASAYASTAENALVNGSYIAAEIIIYNNADATWDGSTMQSAGTVIQSKVWAIWPVALSWAPGKQYTYTIDLAGGGYFEQNTDDGDAELDPILEGAVIRFATVTVDNWIEQPEAALYI